MPEFSLPPSERGATSRLIDAVDRLTERMAAGVPVNWWDLVPSLDGELIAHGFSNDTVIQTRTGMLIFLRCRASADRLELSLVGADGRLHWQRCLFTRR